MIVQSTRTKTLVGLATFMLVTSMVVADLIPHCKIRDSDSNGRLICLKCFDGYFLTKDGRSCPACDDSCATCQHSPDLCRSCAPSFFEVTPNKCESCSPGCLKCSSKLTCDACADNFFLSSQTHTCQECIKGCLRCLNAHRCLDCEFGMSKQIDASGADVCIKQIQYHSAEVITALVALAAILLFPIIMLALCWRTLAKRAGCIAEPLPSSSFVSQPRGQSFMQATQDDTYKAANDN